MLCILKLRRILALGKKSLFQQTVIRANVVVISFNIGLDPRIGRGGPAFPCFRNSPCRSSSLLGCGIRIFKTEESQSPAFRWQPQQFAPFGCTGRVIVDVFPAAAQSITGRSTSLAMAPGWGRTDR